MSEQLAFKGPWTLGIIEDEPGVKYYAIAGEHTIFARIPAIDGRMRATAALCASAPELKARVAELEAALQNCLSVAPEEDPFTTSIFEEGKKVLERQAEG